eukprot:CAMPEP_0170465778 /NCGR_PEP_ID=MMETSP0123-20130129/9991_1 /TAXON_ID=182087 /ORGANISM="Favella ehrenbergii, Strain Fehren 1" /LENGTH=50 /DNA_ID=CAMNT_0010731753 /DNA_START=1 /DNA_END=153 /DNA_ORIENTATION=-
MARPFASGTETEFARQLSHKIDELFDRIDLDNSGTITLEEMQGCLKAKLK